MFDSFAWTKTDTTDYHEQGIYFPLTTHCSSPAHYCWLPEKARLANSLHQQTIEQTSSSSYAPHPDLLREKLWIVITHEARPNQRLPAPAATLCPSAKMSRVSHRSCHEEVDDTLRWSVSLINKTTSPSLHRDRSLCPVRSELLQSI